MLIVRRARQQGRLLFMAARFAKAAWCTGHEDGHIGALRCCFFRWRTHVLVQLSAHTGVCANVNTALA